MGWEITKQEGKSLKLSPKTTLDNFKNNCEKNKYHWNKKPQQIKIFILN